MKTCTYCGYENPKHRLICLHCEKSIERESGFSKIYLGIVMIIGGIILVASDSNYDFVAFKLIPIPYGLTIIGVAVMIFGVVRLLSILIREPDNKAVPDTPGSEGSTDASTDKGKEI